MLAPSSSPINTEQPPLSSSQFPSISIHFVYCHLFSDSFQLLFLPFCGFSMTMGAGASQDSDDLTPYPVYSHPKQLDLSSVDQLPDSHAWTSSSEGGYTRSGFCNQVESETVPVVDLADDNASELLGYACRTWGVFQVKNHGFPRGLLQETESLTRRLFSLPMQQKLRAARSSGQTSGYGMAPISSFFPKVMWSEGFTIIGSPLEHARQLWPRDYNTFWSSNFHPHYYNYH